MRDGEKEPLTLVSRRWTDPAALTSADQSWSWVSKWRREATSSRTRLGPGTLKCSMQDRRNAQLCVDYFTGYLGGFFFSVAAHSEGRGSNICPEFDHESEIESRGPGTRQSRLLMMNVTA